MKRYIHADTDMATKPGGITYYAVDCRSMYSGYHYLEAYDSEAEAKVVYDTLEVLLDRYNNNEIGEDEYRNDAYELYSVADDRADEVDMRRDVDKNNVYTPPGRENEKWKIVNKVAVDVYYK